VILSVGTDTSDLVVTNGYRVWQRSIPIGGNHFTKALTKQLQLTFAKAEHLKRNTRAAKPEDAKALFKAMKPVFGDLLMEVQTSIRYFRMNVDKEAHIKQVIALGSAMKLPGLRRYLEQNLDMPVSQLDGFRRLAGSAVLSAPTFKENVLSFGVCYGLALQGLGRSILRTNLLPQEINTARMIDEKKPWALAAATVLLLGFTVSYFGHWLPWYGATDSQYTKAFADVDGVVGRATAQKSAYATAESEYKTAIETGERLVGNVEGRMQLPELIRAINACLPQNDKDPEAQPENNSTRKDLMITSFGCWLKGDMSEWFTKEVRDEWQKANPGKEIAAEDVKSDGGAQEKPEGAGDAGGGPDGEVPPQGETAGGEGAERRPGYIVELRGHHFHNSDPKEPAGAPYVQQTLISALESGEVELPGEGGKPEKVRLRDLGIRYPTLVYSSELTDVPNPAYDKGDPASKQPPRLKKFDFYLQFWWEARPRSARLQKAADEKKKAAAAAEDGAAANGAPGE
jgi:type IV pilus assembly protein PilM